jgi:endonuclease/exonuclease/phosphatase family metal-dependent hydrolase
MVPHDSLRSVITRAPVVVTMLLWTGALQACGMMGGGSGGSAERAARASEPEVSANRATLVTESVPMSPLTIMSWNVLFEYQRIPQLISASAGTAPATPQCDPERAPFACTVTDPSVCRRCDGAETHYNYSEYTRSDLAYIITRPELRWENRSQLIVRQIRETNPDIIALQEVQGDAEFGPDMFGFFRRELGEQYEIIAPDTFVENLRLIEDSGWPGPACNRDQCRACRHGVGCTVYDLGEDRKSSQNWLLVRRGMFSVEEGGAFEIPTDDRNGRAVQRRFVTWARLTHTGSRQQFVALAAHTHPKIEDLRVAEVNVIAEFIRGLAAPAVMMGDFNATPGTPSYEVVRSSLVDTFRAYVGEGDPRVMAASTALQLGTETDRVRPQWRIDYIWATSDWVLSDAAVLTPRFDDVRVDVIHDGTYLCDGAPAIPCVLRNGVYASDHFPVVARINLPAPAPAVP